MPNNNNNNNKIQILIFIFIVTTLLIYFFIDFWECVLKAFLFYLYGVNRGIYLERCFCS